MKLQAAIIGTAGELRVRSELLLKGFYPAVFDQDMGADIVLNNGKRLQVKTSLKPINSKKDYSWRYSFNIRQAQIRNAGNGTYKKKFTRKNYKDHVDFFVFWCVRNDIFYIIPENEVGEKISLVIPTPNKDRKYKKHIHKKSVSKYEKYKNNWEILK